MPKLPVEFVHGLGIGVIAVDRVLGARDSVLALVSSMLGTLVV